MALFSSSLSPQSRYTAQSGVGWRIPEVSQRCPPGPRGAESYTWPSHPFTEGMRNWASDWESHRILGMCMPPVGWKLWICSHCCFKIFWAKILVTLILKILSLPGPVIHSWTFYLIQKQLDGVGIINPNFNTQRNRGSEWFNDLPTSHSWEETRLIFQTVPASGTFSKVAPCNWDGNKWPRSLCPILSSCWPLSFLTWTCGCVISAPTRPLQTSFASLSPYSGRLYGWHSLEGVKSVANWWVQSCAHCIHLLESI